MYQKEYHIHFVGIGGIGMSGIAELLCNLDYRVSGSDLHVSEITANLSRLGAEIYKGHDARQIEEADVVVVSSAIGDGNPEVVAAKQSAIPVIRRADMLAELMRLKYSIVVAGAHGKTSTTALLASILAAGDFDPTVVIGGKLMGMGTNAVLGKGEFIVAEADESDGSFLKFSPTIAVVTNIDREHLDFYRGLDEIKSVFLDFLHRIPFYGLAVLCLDSPPVQELLPDLQRRHVTYGCTVQADLQATDIAFEGLESFFRVKTAQKELGLIRLNRPGMHSVYNALAAIAVGLELEIPFEGIAEALARVEGVARRMEIKGEMDGITVIDDYGHHPTEIKATLNAIRQSYPERRVVVVFQPHRYSRTQMLFDDFTRAFNQSDMLVVSSIYAASEKPIEGVSGQLLFEGIREHGHKEAHYAEDLEAAVTILQENVVAKDVVVTLGAGNVYEVGESFLNRMGSGAVVHR